MTRKPKLVLLGSNEELGKLMTPASCLIWVDTIWKMQITGGEAYCMADKVTYDPIRKM